MMTGRGGGSLERLAVGMRALITGAAGFIGSHLTEAILADGWEVVGLDGFTDYYPRSVKEANLERARNNRKFRLVEGLVQELPLAGLVDDVDCIYHLAAQAGVRSSWGREFETYSNHNVLATQRLLEAATAAKRRPRVVYASSSSVYGDSPILPFREDAACRPVSPYGVTKLAAEHLALLYQKSHDLSVVALRFFTVYGPRQRPDMAFHRFLAAALRGSTVTLFGDGTQTRDFTYVSDIVAAIRAAGDRGRSGHVYNIGGGQRLALREVLARIEAVTGRRLQVEHAGPQKGDMRDTFADTSAAERDLGFRSSVRLDDGLAREWDWLRGRS
jgi:UDP-glucuronate 4-epimerase